MAANFNFRFVVAALFLFGAWASQATARTLEEPSVFERHETWMARHGRSYKDHVNKAKRFKISKENVKFFESSKAASVDSPPNETTDTIDQENCDENDKGRGDWAPFLIAAVLFVLLQPGLIVQIPGNNRWIEFGTMKTSFKAIFVHTMIFIFICVIIILVFHDNI